MRVLHREPAIEDFTSASEYEASAPASFGLPEQPVLYYVDKINGQTLYIVSDGVYIWNTKSGLACELDQATVHDGKLFLPSYTLELGTNRQEDVSNALNRCKDVFGSSTQDSIEMAMPLDLESGDADDLGDADFEQAYTSLSSQASKRTRSN